MLIKCTHVKLLMHTQVHTHMSRAYRIETKICQRKKLLSIQYRSQEKCAILLEMLDTTTNK